MTENIIKMHYCIKNKQIEFDNNLYYHDYS